MPTGHKGRPPSKCHPDKPNYARGMCVRCYKGQPDQYRKNLEWRRKNPEKWKLLMERSNAKRKASGADRNLRLIRDYGITSDDYNRMLAEQGGGCKLCGWAPQRGHRRLAVDHCHKTGRVRGLLCAVCNGGIGKLESVGIDKVRIYLGC